MILLKKSKVLIKSNKIPIFLFVLCTLFLGGCKKEYIKEKDKIFLKSWNEGFGVMKNEVVNGRS